MGNLVMDKINNFNLEKKFNEMRKSEEYKHLSDEELQEMIIENSLDENINTNIDEESKNENETKKNIDEEVSDKTSTSTSTESNNKVSERNNFGFKLKPGIEKQLNSLSTEINNIRREKEKDAGETPVSVENPLLQLKMELDKLEINVSDVDEKMILNIDYINDFYEILKQKYYNIKYHKIIRFFIDLFGYTDKFLEKLPILDNWNRKVNEFDFSLLKFPIATTKTYKDYIYEGNTPLQTKIAVSIYELLISLVNNAKSILTRYSVIQSNEEYLNSLGLNAFGDDYYQSLLACVGSYIQLFRAVTELTNLSEINLPNNNINIDSIIPLFLWISNNWNEKYKKKINTKKSLNKKETVDTLYFIKIISEDLLAKLPEDADRLNNILSPIPEIINNMRRDHDILIKNINYVESTILLLYIKKFMNENEITIVFDRKTNNKIEIKKLEKQNNK